MKASIIGMLSILWALTTYAQVFNPKTFKLSNGMEAVVVENPNATAVTHMVWYRVGSVDEDHGRRGLAHFFEHLMFKGTEKFPGDSFNTMLIRNGAQFNAFTSLDYTAYYETVAPHLLGKVMEMEADRMVNLRIAPDVFEPEKKVVLEERNMSVDNNPQGLFYEQFNAARFHNHPYGQPVIGWRHEIEALNLGEAQAFHKKFYNPANALLVVSGKTTLSEVKKLAESTYGVLKGSPVVRAVHTEPPSHSSRYIETVHPQVKHPFWMRTYTTAGLSTRSIEESSALEVLAKILGGGQSSILYSKLVLDLKCAQDISVYFNDAQRDFGQFSFTATPTNLASIPTLESAIQEQLEQIKKGNLDQKEIDRAKNNLIAQATYARDSLEAPAFAFGYTLINGGKIDDVEQWPTRIKNVTLDHIKAAAAKIFTHDNKVVGLLKPLKEDVKK